MDRNKYIITLVFGSWSVTPPQNNTEMTSSFNWSDVTEQLKKDDMPLDATVTMINIYRPNLSTDFLSVSELDLMREYKCDIRVESNGTFKTTIHKYIGKED